MFVLSRLAIVVVVVVIVIVAFYAAMNTMNIEMVAKDALTLRAKVVLVHDEEKVDSSGLKNFFTDKFLKNDTVLNGTVYSDFKVTNFYQRVNIHPPVVWPWQDEVTVDADDIITDLTGRELDQMDEEGNTIKGTKKPPEWENGSYKLQMIKVGDAWKIDGIEFVKPIAVETPSASPTAAPTPSAPPEDTPAPEDENTPAPEDTGTAE